MTAGAMVAVGFGLAGCSTFAPADSVEIQIVSQLGAATADCPTDLGSTVGASTASTASPAVADEPAAMQADAGAVTGADVATAVSAPLATLTGVTPDKLSCPDLPAEVGASIRCELVAGRTRSG